MQHKSDQMEVMVLKNQKGGRRHRRLARCSVFAVFLNVFAIWMIATPVLADPIITPITTWLVGAGLSATTAAALATFTVNTALYSAGSWSPSRLFGGGKS